MHWFTITTKPINTWIPSLISGNCRTQSGNNFCSSPHLCLSYVTHLTLYKRILCVAFTHHAVSCVTPFTLISTDVCVCIYTVFPIIPKKKWVLFSLLITPRYTYVTLYLRHVILTSRYTYVHFICVWRHLTWQAWRNGNNTTHWHSVGAIKTRAGIMRERGGGWITWHVITGNSADSVTEGRGGGVLLPRPGNNHIVVYGRFKVDTCHTSTRQANHITRIISCDFLYSALYIYIGLPSLPTYLPTYPLLHVAYLPVLPYQLTYLPTHCYTYPTYLTRIFCQLTKKASPAATLKRIFLWSFLLRNCCIGRTSYIYCVYIYIFMSNTYITAWSCR